MIRILSCNLCLHNAAPLCIYLDGNHLHWFMQSLSTQCPFVSRIMEHVGEDGQGTFIFVPIVHMVASVA